MPRSRGRRPPPNKPLPAQLPRKGQPRFPIARVIWSAILAACTLLGVVVLWPQVSADVDKEPDLSSALPNSVTFRNLGWVTLRNFSVGFALCHSVSESGASVIGRDNPNKCSGEAVANFANHVTAWNGHTLKTNEPYTLPPAHNFIGFGTEKLVEGDVDYILTFWAWPIPFFYHQVQFRFATQRQPNGTLIWAPIPVD